MVKKLLIILFIIMMVLSGCTRPIALKDYAKLNVSTDDKADCNYNFPQPLTLAQVTTAMMLEGLPFSQNREENPDDYAINGVSPAIYTIKQNDNILMIYIFESIALRQEVCNNSEGVGYFIADKIPQKENWLTLAITAKNTLIIDMCNTENYQTNTNPLKRIFLSLRAATDSLNETKEVIFADKGNYWDAKYTIRYYQYWYEDKTGAIHICQHSNGKWEIKYLGPDPESISVIKHKYTHLNGAGSGSGTIHGSKILQKIGKDYYLQFGNLESNTVPDKNDVYTLAIQWDDQKETLHLKSIKQD